MRKRRGTYLGRVVEEASHGESLLVASTERVPPFSLRVPPTLTLDDAVHLEQLQDREEVRIRDAACVREGSTSAPTRRGNRERGRARTSEHLRPRVRVDDLVAQGAERQVRSLRDVGELARRRLGDRTTCDEHEPVREACEARGRARKRTHRRWARARRGCGRATTCPCRCRRRRAGGSTGKRWSVCSLEAVSPRAGPSSAGPSREELEEGELTPGLT